MQNGIPPFSLHLSVVNKRIIVSVSSDIATDQRVQKQCRALHKSGYSVTLVGRDLGRDIPIDLPFKYLHLSLPFRKGPLMYAWFNIRLFFYLLFHKADFYVSNDLDTLLATGLAARLKSKPYWYDSHEYFTQVPEVVNRPFVQKMWRVIERAFVSHAAIVSTVSPAIVEHLQSDYRIKDVLLVRNFPEPVESVIPKSRKELGIPESSMLMILQGNGINIDRGGEELIEGLTQLNDVFLLVVGHGDVIPLMKSMAAEFQVNDKVRFIPSIPYKELLTYTAMADVGLCFDKPTNLNYQYSLPNRLFDYALVGLPVLVAKLQETEKWINTYKVGVLIDSVSVETIVAGIEAFRALDSARYKEYSQNARRASLEHNWSSEMNPVLDRINTILH